MDWNDVAHDWDRLRAVVNAVMNQKVWRICLLAEEGDSVLWTDSAGFQSYRVAHLLCQ
jgi:hypothetical protein